MVKFENKICPTHSTRIRPYFGEISIPPPPKGDHLSTHHTEPSAPVPPPRCATIADLLNSVFVATQVPIEHPMVLDTLCKTYTVSILHRDTLDINSDSVFPMVTKVIKDHKSLSLADQAAFYDASRGDIDFLFKDTVK